MNMLVGDESVKSLERYGSKQTAKVVCDIKSWMLNKHTSF